MNVKVKNRNETCNCFVAYLDIMGFSRIVKENLHEANLVLDRFLYGTDFMKENNEELSVAVFSDSVFIFTKKDDDVESVNIFLKYLSALILSCFDRDIPLKGAISYGQVAIDEIRNKFLGTPIVDAYKLQNKLFYFGVVIDDIAYQRIKELKTKILETVDHLDFFLYETPFKTLKCNKGDKIITEIEYKQKYNLNCPRAYEPRDKKRIELLDCTNSNGAQIYKNNTLEFIEESFKYMNWKSLEKQLQGK